jgi:cyclopropane-fatty-acyl-phospholipid synthase
MIEAAERLTHLTTPLLRKGLFAKLSQMKFGALHLHEDGLEHVLGDRLGPIQVHVVVHNPEFYWLMATEGSIGAAEGYVNKDWTTDNLLDVVRLFCLNRGLLSRVDSGLVNIKYPLRTIDYWRRRNDKTGARKNIQAHYDLSNDLFGVFLDERMMYSSAYYSDWTMSLEDAQRDKLERICRKLNLKAGDEVCEIGTGWGGFAIYAAQNFGCHVTTTTISDRQHDYAKNQIKKANLEAQITLLKRDYRDLTGTFNKVVSIEMIEAVGHQYLGDYLEKISDLLAPDGAALLQAIVINDQEYDRAVNEVDFIKKYIFPGSFIPSLHAILDEAKANTDLRLYHMDDFSAHYAKTLLDWRRRFLAGREQIEKLGFNEDFIRLWDYYFCYCAGGFQERAIGVTHLIFGKPLNRVDWARGNKWDF